MRRTVLVSGADQSRQERLGSDGQRRGAGDVRGALRSYLTNQNALPDAR